MPTVGAAVSAEVKRRFEDVAKERCTTASRLAAALITEFLGLASTPAPSQPEKLTTGCEINLAARDAAKTEQVHVRLAPYYFLELGRLASERQWYRSTYLANLFLAHADRRPVLCDAEINALRQVARQLADLGRSVNEIAKRLRRSPDAAHEVGSLEVALLKMLIERQGNAVAALIKANMQGWGIDDEQA